MYIVPLWPFSGFAFFIMTGLSNGFSAWTNADISSTAQANGWIKPRELWHIWRQTLRSKSSEVCLFLGTQPIIYWYWLKCLQYSRPSVLRSPINHDIAHGTTTIKAEPCSEFETTLRGIHLHYKNTQLVMTLPCTIKYIHKTFSNIFRNLSQLKQICPRFDKISLLEAYNSIDQPWI